MRKTLFFTVAVALGLSLPAFRSVDWPQEANAEAIAGAMAALDEFMLTFNSRDMEAWAATLNYPHV